MRVNVRLLLSQFFNELKLALSHLDNLFNQPPSDFVLNFSNPKKSYQHHDALKCAL